MPASLLFDATGERIDCGTGSSLDDLNPVTIAAWIRPATFGNGAGNDSRIFFKNNGGTAQMALTLLVSGTFSIGIGRASAGANVEASTTEFACYALNHWMFMAGQLDLSTDANCKMFVGDAANLVKEPSGYVAQTKGSGAAGTTAGASARIGSNAGGAFLNGKIGFVGIWNRLLPLGEIISQQFRPHVTSGCKLFQLPGMNGTGTQPDLSGNGNNGTVTGATVDSGPPIGQLFGQSEGLPYIVSGGGGSSAKPAAFYQMLSA